MGWDALTTIQNGEWYNARVGFKSIFIQCIHNDDLNKSLNNAQVDYHTVNTATNNVI